MKKLEDQEKRKLSDLPKKLPPTAPILTSNRNKFSTVVELKEELKRRNLPVSGDKAKLRVRLRNDDSRKKKEEMRLKCPPAHPPKASSRQNEDKKKKKMKVLRSEAKRTVPSSHLVLPETPSKRAF